MLARFHLDGDVADQTGVARLIEDTFAEYGRLDYMINNAGIAIGGDSRDLSVQQWRRVLDVDLLGVVYGTVHAYQLMARQASFANNCLLARRLVERGVRVVELYDSDWDHHANR